MAVRYPGPVSRHNLVCLLLMLWYLVPVWDRFCHDDGRFPRWWQLVSLVDTGPPRTSPVESESEWLGECRGSRSVLSERHWSTRMGVRGHGFRGVGTVRYLCSVFIKSIDSTQFIVGHTVGSWSKWRINQE